jgi:hypothetical protein
MVVGLVIGVGNLGIQSRIILVMSRFWIRLQLLGRLLSDVMLIELGLGFGDGYVDLSLHANELTGQSYGGFMTCKTVEADSGVFSLGSKSSVPLPITRRIETDNKWR